MPTVSFSWRKIITLVQMSTVSFSSWRKTIELVHRHTVSFSHWRKNTSNAHAYSLFLMKKNYNICSNICSLFLLLKKPRTVVQMSTVCLSSWRKNNNISTNVYGLLLLLKKKKLIQMSTVSYSSWRMCRKNKTINSTHLHDTFMFSEAKQRLVHIYHLTLIW